MNKPSAQTGSNELPSIDEIYLNLFALIEEHITQFPSFLNEATVAYKAKNLIKKEIIEQEDDITGPFGRFFRNLGTDFDFENQSKTPETNATTDIGIISKKYSKHEVICFVEAKRLPTPESPKREETEYVYYKKESKQGGIERFKTERHAGKEKLPYSIMLGYIQSEPVAHWHEKVNGWISQQIIENENKLLKMKTRLYNGVPKIY